MNTIAEKPFAEVTNQCPTTFLRIEIANDFDRVYPNFVRPLRISVTIPVRSAQAERSFTRLQLLKSNLRSKLSDHSVFHC